MNVYGIEVNIKNAPVLDPTFVPLSAFNKEFLRTAKKPLAVAVERSGGLISVYDTFIHGTPDMAEADNYYIDRLVKFLLWPEADTRFISAVMKMYIHTSARHTAKTVQEHSTLTLWKEFMKRTLK